MSVDYFECESCGEMMCDCGEYYYCDECGRHLCLDCLAKPYETDEETGEMSKDCCPFCSGELVHNDDLLQFLLNEYVGVSREEAVTIYKTMNGVKR